MERAERKVKQATAIPVGETMIWNMKKKEKDDELFGRVCSKKNKGKSVKGSLTGWRVFKRKPRMPGLFFYSEIIL